MRHRGRAVGLHEDRQRAKAIGAFIEYCHAFGMPPLVALAHRASEIAALPTVEWKGRTLRTIRCHGETGRGPHDVHVPESLLWSLLDLQTYRCVFH